MGLEEIDPERIYQGRQKLGTLDKAMASLMAKQREIVVRSRLKGETYAQISRARGWREADISRQLNRALKILADAVEPGGSNTNTRRRRYRNRLQRLLVPRRDRPPKP